MGDGTSREGGQLVTTVNYSSTVAASGHQSREDLSSGSKLLSLGKTERMINFNGLGALSAADLKIQVASPVA